MGLTNSWDDSWSSQVWNLSWPAIGIGSVWALAVTCRCLLRCEDVLPSKELLLKTSFYFLSKCLNYLLHNTSSGSPSIREKHFWWMLGRPLQTLAALFLAQGISMALLGFAKIKPQQNRCPKQETLRYLKRTCQKDLWNIGIIFSY